MGRCVVPGGRKSFWQPRIGSTRESGNRSFSNLNKVGRNGNTKLKPEPVGVCGPPELSRRSAVQVIMAKLVVAVVGTALILLGLPLLVLPGPGILLILAGLALLSLEFPWAKKLSERAKERWKRRS